MEESRILVPRNPRHFGRAASALQFCPEVTGQNWSATSRVGSGSVLDLNYLGDTVPAPAEEGVLFRGMCTQISFGFGANSWLAHSASRSARRCDHVKCGLATVTAIFPWSTILMALRASGVQ